MVKIKLIEIIGENCITIDQGTKVFAKIHPLLTAGNAVELEFEGVQVFASPFFNNAIGKLLEDLKPEKLNELLTVTKLNPPGPEILRKVIENSKKYYSSPDRKRAVDKTLDEASENL